MTICTVVFIDSRVSAIQPQLSGLDAASTLTVVLNPEQNGLSQMRDALAGLSGGLDAIHVVSHGNAGALQLGDLWLTGGNLSEHTDSLASLGQSLLPTGDVLLYGCNVGQGEVGQQFVAALAQATGADVAASTNATGFGGDWVLELQTGSVNAAVLAASGYTSQLVSYPFISNVAGYRVDTLNNVTMVVDVDASNGDSGSTALASGNHALMFADRSYFVQIPVLVGEFRVNTTTYADQSYPAVAALRDGGYVVTWQSNGQDGSGWGIYAQRFDAIGNILGTETLINATTVNDQSRPAITALSDGGYMVTWQSWLQDGSGWGIYAQRFNASGYARNFEVRIHTTTAGWQEAPAVTALSGSGYVVTWHSDGQDGSAYGIYAQRFDASGNALGAETRVNTTTYADQFRPAVAALSGGGYVVTWQSNIQDGSIGGIYAQRFDASGNALGVETRVNTTTYDDQASPDVAALSSGGYVVTWQSNGQDGSGWGIYAQRFDSSGNALGTETRINTTTVKNQLESAVTELSDGRYVVTWSSNHLNVGNSEVYAQRFDAGGNAIGAEIQVNTTTTAGQLNPAITALSGGGYVVTWASYGQDGHGDGIFTQRFDADGLPVGIVITGTAGDDVLNGGAGTQRLFGDTGNDMLDGGTGADFLSGGEGSDTYVLDDLNDITIDQGVTVGDVDTVISSVTYALNSGLENLALTGSASINGTGNARANFIIGNSGNNTLTGLEGNDTLDGGTGADRLVGGTGDDLYCLDDSGDVVVEASNEGTDTVESTVSAYTLTIYTENLTLMGSSSNSGSGNSLNNRITGNSGNNTLDGGAGSDTLIGGAGNDSIDGGTGTDTADFSQETAPVSVILYGNQSHGLSIGVDTLTSIENIIGSNYNDLAYGDSGDNLIQGGLGQDTLDGAEGNDTLQGQDGNDLLSGLAGNDSLDGGESNDSLYGWADLDTLVGGNGDDRLFGGTQADVLDGGDGADNLEGDDGNDTLAGGVGNDTLRGWNDNDSMDGGDGDDALFGGAGTDSMVGGSGADNLEGDDGNDTIAGGAGNDTLRGWNDSDNLSGDDGDDLVVGWSGNDSLVGGLGDDSLFGDDGADSLVGGAGGDVLQGGLGNDLYVFEADFGFDGVRDYDYLAGNSDTFQFNGVNLVELSFARVGDALKVERTASAGADVITVNDWYMAGSSGAYRIETWVMGDGTYTAAQIEALVV